MSEALLRDLPLFAAVPDAELRTLVGSLPRTAFPAGSLMLREGERGDRFFIILSGRIAIVTNRLGSECADTEAVFRDQNLPFDMMLCRPDGMPSDKNPRFDAVAAGTTKYGGPPLEVLVFVGDNILDFPELSQASVKQNPALLEPFGRRFFALSNPMYGSWQ